MQTKVTTTIEKTVVARIPLPLCNKCRACFPKKDERSGYPMDERMVSYKLDDGGMLSKPEPCITDGCLEQTSQARHLTLTARSKVEKVVE